MVVTFSVLDRKYSFSANLVQKIKMVSLRQNLVPRLSRIRKIMDVIEYTEFIMV